jgi:hypothetical protein
MPDVRQKAPCVGLCELPHGFGTTVGARPFVYRGASRDQGWDHCGLRVVLAKIRHALRGLATRIRSFLAWQIRAYRTGVYYTVHAAPERVVKEWFEWHGAIPLCNLSRCESVAESQIG